MTKDLLLLCSLTFKKTFLQCNCCNLDSLGWGGQDRKCAKLCHSIQTGRRNFCFKAFTHVTLQMAFPHAASIPKFLDKSQHCVQQG